MIALTVIRRLTEWFSEDSSASDEISDDDINATQMFLPLTVEEIRDTMHIRFVRDVLNLYRSIHLKGSLL